jgi:hypothetical protein
MSGFYTNNTKGIPSATGSFTHFRFGSKVVMNGATVFRTAGYVSFPFLIAWWGRGDASRRAARELSFMR